MSGATAPRQGTSAIVPNPSRRPAMKNTITLLTAVLMTMAVFSGTVGIMNYAVTDGTYEARLA